MCVLLSPDAVWEFKDDEGKWHAFAKPDAAVLEKHYAQEGDQSHFSTTNFSFNAGYKTIYEINFAKMTQKNMVRGRVVPKYALQVLGGGEFLSGGSCGG